MSTRFLANRRLQFTTAILYKPISCGLENHILHFVTLRMASIKSGYFVILCVTNVKHSGTDKRRTIR